MSDREREMEKCIKRVIELCDDDEIVILYHGKKYDFIRHTNNADLRDAENRLHRYIDDLTAGYG